MKIVTAKEMVRIEKLAYEHGEQEKAFMESAGQGIAIAVQQAVAALHIYPKVILLCGSGNNAGDAYVAGMLLGVGGYEVSALALAPPEKSTLLCQLNGEAYRKKGKKIRYITSSEEITFEEGTIIVDGLLGTGFRGKVEGLYYSAIEQANASGLPIISIDTPSGVDGTTGEIATIAIKAYKTVFLGLPKVGCFLADAWHHVGKATVYDFGLGSYAISQAQAVFEWIEESTIKKLLPPLNRCRNKYQAGYVVGIAGSAQLGGASILSSLAALRSGAGIVKLFHSPDMVTVQIPLEIIHESYHAKQALIEAMQKASALFMGPGIGKSDEAASIVKDVLALATKPCVIDADALSILAVHPLALPPLSILTPHMGEMMRLLRLQEAVSKEKLIELTQAYANEHQVIIVLKGAPTFLFHPKKIPHICSKGDPGMATAGSGDVLTGMITAMLAQLQNPWQAALLGTYLHGLAGEIAAQTNTSYSMIASDIIQALPAAFKLICS